ncbi:unnamed protein product, partial [Allacma fusca]
MQNSINQNQQSLKNRIDFLSMEGKNGNGSQRPE